MNWRHTKLGNWIWRKWYYRVDWFIGEMKFRIWLRYAKNHYMWVNITPDYLKLLDKYDNPKRKRLSNLFRSFDKWDK